MIAGSRLVNEQFLTCSSFLLKKKSDEFELKDLNLRSPHVWNSLA